MTTPHSVQPLINEAHPDMQEKDKVYLYSQIASLHQQLNDQMAKVNQLKLKNKALENKIQTIRNGSDATSLSLSNTDKNVVPIIRGVTEMKSQIIELINKAKITDQTNIFCRFFTFLYQHVNNNQQNSLLTFISNAINDLKNYVNMTPNQQDFERMCEKYVIHLSLSDDYEDTLSIIPDSKIADELFGISVEDHAQLAAELKPGIDKLISKLSQTQLIHILEQFGYASKDIPLTKKELQKHVYDLRLRYEIMKLDRSSSSLTDINEMRDREISQIFHPNNVTINNSSINNNYFNNSNLNQPSASKPKRSASTGKLRMSSSNGHFNNNNNNNNIPVVKNRIPVQTVDTTNLIPSRRTSSSSTNTSSTATSTTPTNPANNNNKLRQPIQQQQPVQPIQQQQRSISASKRRSSNISTASQPVPYAHISSGINKLGKYGRRSIVNLDKSRVVDTNFQINVPSISRHPKSNQNSHNVPLTTNQSAPSYYTDEVEIDNSFAQIPPNPTSPVPSQTSTSHHHHHHHSRQPSTSSITSNNSVPLKANVSRSSTPTRKQQQQQQPQQPPPPAAVNIIVKQPPQPPKQSTLPTKQLPPKLPTQQQPPIQPQQQQPTQPPPIQPQQPISQQQPTQQIPPQQQSQQSQQQSQQSQQPTQQSQPPKQQQQPIPPQQQSQPPPKQPLEQPVVIPSVPVVSKNIKITTPVEEPVVKTANNNINITTSVPPIDPPPPLSSSSSNTNTNNNNNSKPSSKTPTPKPTENKKALPITISKTALPISIQPVEVEEEEEQIDQPEFEPPLEPPPDNPIADENQIKFIPPTQPEPSEKPQQHNNNNNNVDDDDEDFYNREFAQEDYYGVECPEENNEITNEVLDDLQPSTDYSEEQDPQ